MENKKYIAEVIVNNSVNKLDKLFDYIIPPQFINIIKEGTRVLVPFGKGNRQFEAYVFGVNIKLDEDTSKLKEVIRPIDEEPILTINQIHMIKWMKGKYLCKYIEAIQCLIPAGVVNKEKRFIYVNREKLNNHKYEMTEIQKDIINYVEEKGKINVESLYKRFSYNEVYRVIKQLENEGIIIIENKVDSRIDIIKEKYVRLVISKDLYKEALDSIKGAKRQQELMEFLKEKVEVKISELVNSHGFGRTIINGLLSRNIVEVIEKESKRDPLLNLELKPFPKLEPNDEQRVIIEEITEAINNNRVETYLIHGVTGSGKTEIYLQLIENTLNEGKQGIVLVPEISLTPQTVERFRGRFKEGIALFHSGLSDGERYDEWRRVASGEANIVIGARSAIFAPFNNLGLIIIDEEHEHTYKSDLSPKYHVKEIAEYRSKHEQSVLVLGSATPSIESYFEGVESIVKVRELKNRARNAKPPNIEVIDMRRELECGNKSILSRRLHSEIEKNLEAKKQTILFLNRRGYSTFVSCRSCGHVVKCKQCDISLTFHMTSKELQCHYCGDKYTAPRECPECSSKNIKYFGVGTQKLEMLIQSYFPKAVISRMDLDATSKKGAHNEILESFKSGEIDIMIGTQMITKGLDFPNVTLVGIITADTMLNMPDFRAPEKVFQQVLQVSGRAGRGFDEGKVILQTYNPEHYSIMLAAKQDYISFFEKEVELRKAFNYPPFSKLINITFTGENEKETYLAISKITDNIKYILKSKGYTNELDDIVFGPNEGMIYRVKNKYRFYVLLKSNKENYTLLKAIIKYLLIDSRQKFVSDNIITSIDMNPLFIV
ncbi:primosomal protein N' [Serpentinicella alkaliphila]|uniref:Replication restart protein PriA n=1 Tax=Serpentinicella alkaliphila TaxID=1734049 RepID=A0A4R2THH9_9FIRM|nr:primosomal protein N' [Serpentinicella alkaliphila]QUH26212.1 primosomal protein N' [Serpentinicella alkaliphila]TCQ01672.1 replication restart DNA helicase PriA [Serpentinicella alkaliphila]